jgi:hypothetical protein
MIELSIDHPVPELIAVEDASTLRAIDDGIAQLDSGPDRTPPTGGGIVLASVALQVACVAKAASVSG